MLVTTRKIDAVVGSEESPFEYGNTFETEMIKSGARLTIGIDSAQDVCLRELVAELSGPFHVLYVLHTSRTDEAALGRYESPVLSIDKVQSFLRRFGSFLREDARHDVWVRSHDDDATVVLDRHNIIYAYGPLTTFEDVLRRLGASRKGLPQIPDPHCHYYHSAYDDSEREILAAWPWTRKPLREADFQ